MGKVKTKKHSTFIDMTAMSDVTVLLLTFFMSTATFLEKEPIQVITPETVVDIKIPDANLMTILVKPDGLVYVTLDLPKDRKNILEEIAKDYNINFSDKQKRSFAERASIGVPINQLSAFLDKDMSDQDDILKEAGIPTDSANNQLKYWVQKAKALNPDLELAVKADKGTRYTSVSNVIKTLQDIKENRFHLITNLGKMPEGF
jgi:biopolymer transport protein ExbD